MKPIYEPKGAAKEYGDYALNIYTGCPHRCYYCFAPNVLHREKERFHSCVEPRAERICRERGLDYYIKDSLRVEMQTGGKS